MGKKNNSYWAFAGAVGVVAGYALCKLVERHKKRSEEKLDTLSPFEDDFSLFEDDFFSSGESGKPVAETWDTDDCDIPKCRKNKSASWKDDCSSAEDDYEECEDFTDTDEDEYVADFENEGEVITASEIREADLGDDEYVADFENEGEVITASEIDEADPDEDWSFSSEEGSVPDLNLADTLQEHSIKSNKRGRRSRKKN